ncbi:MAG: hypothetical protein KBD50_01670 [Candidatus Pacebacteria bacterium]|nr:hypothetical protein [Candidatus Paceibacterota bacterium]
MENPPQEEQKQEHGVGPIAGVIIIVAIMLIGGVYFLLMETNKEVPTPSTEETNGQ